MDSHGLVWLLELGIWTPTVCSGFFTVMDSHGLAWPFSLSPSAPFCTHRCCLLRSNALELDTKTTCVLCNICVTNKQRSKAGLIKKRVI